MLLNWFSGFFGASDEKKLKEFSAVIDSINQLEPQMQKLSDEELQALTSTFKKRLAEGSTLDEILPEAFAAVREASVRTIGLRHFDVQLLGGMGYVNDSPTGRLLRDAKLYEIGAGTSEIRRMLIGRQIFDRTA